MPAALFFVALAQCLQVGDSVASPGLAEGIRCESLRGARSLQVLQWQAWPAWSGPCARKRPYPAGMTIKFVVPFVAGGVTDIVGRIVAERLGALWNVPTVVENVPGSGANIGNDRVAKGPAMDRRS